MSQRIALFSQPFVFDQSVYYFVQNLGVVIVKCCCRVLTTIKWHDAIGSNSSHVACVAPTRLTNQSTIDVLAGIIH